MGAIGEIRERSWLVLIVVGGAMIAFILTMVYGNGGGRQEDTIGIGTVNGVKINQDLYNSYVMGQKNQILQQKYRQNPNQQPQLTPQDIQRAQGQAWSGIIVSQLLKKQYQKIGLIVDDFELENVLYGENGYTPSPMFSTLPQFKDSVTGQFDASKLRQALNSLRTSTDPQEVKQYKNIMENVRTSRLSQKYTALLMNGIHATTLEAKKAYEARKTVKNVAYVYKRYTEIPDGAVPEPTEKEIKAYYDQHKNDQQYAQKAHRRIAYFTIPIQPSKEDSLNMLHKLKRLKQKFEKTDKDSAFVMHFSDVKFYADDSTALARPSSAFHMPQMNIVYPDSLSSIIAHSKMGDVIGPYFSGQGAVVAKIKGYKTVNTATVRHILLKAQTPQQFELARAKADSILKVIKKQHNFVAMEKQFNQDQGSFKTEGKYVRFTYKEMVPPFSDFAFNKPIGEMGIVKTNYGIHIVKVLGRKTVKRPILAQVIKKVEPSRTTINQYKSIASNYIYDLYDQFEGKNPEQMQATFDTVAAKNGFALSYLNLYDEHPSASGFSNIAEGKFLKLAYKGEVSVGKLSSAPIHDKIQNRRGQVKERMIIAYVAGIISKGAPSYEMIKPRMKAEVYKEKQAQYLKEKMLGAKNLKNLASTIKGQFKTEGLTFSSTNTAVGREPRLIGLAFSGLSDGEVSNPVKGTSGVFVLKVLKTTPAPATTNFVAEKNQIQTRERSVLQRGFGTALQKMADVVDNRKLRQYGVN